MATREYHDTVIVGAGQAGLAMSYHLREAGREHVILERAQVASRWRSERWDSLCLQFPNWSLQLPGQPHSRYAADGFAHRNEIVAFVEQYARAIDAPVRCGAHVTSLSCDARSGRLGLQCGTTMIEADNVVLATGPFQKPSIPQMSVAIPPEVRQIHSSEYRNPSELAPGAVLVIGSGGSGAQITEDLHHSGRTVYLSVGRHRRIPRRYRGRDALAWLSALGVLDRTVDELPGRLLPPGLLFSGVEGGHSVDLRQFAAAGIVLLGRLRAITDGCCAFDSDVEERLSFADNAAADLIKAIDDYVRGNNIAAPVEEAMPPAAGTPIAAPTMIKFKSANISTVVWCTGFQFDFDWVRLPIFDERGVPQQRRGVTASRGVYLLGLYWMHKLKSATFSGVGEDAAYLAAQIAQR